MFWLAKDSINTLVQMKFKEVKLKNNNKKICLLPTLITGWVSPWLTHVPSFANMHTFALIKHYELRKSKLNLDNWKVEKMVSFKLC